MRPVNFSAVTGVRQVARRDVFDRVGGYNEEFAVGFKRRRLLSAHGGWLLHIFSPYTELYHYEFPSRGREEANEEKLRRWKREQALFMQHWPEFFLDGDLWRNPNLSSESEFDDL